MKNILIILFLLSSLGFSKVTTSQNSGNWSNPSIWNNGVPAAGDEIHIAANTIVTYDVNSTAIFKVIYVHGELTFKTDAVLNLNVGAIIVSRTINNLMCHMITDAHTMVNEQSVNKGVLKIGTFDNPIGGNVTITLHYFDDFNGIDCYPGIVAYDGIVHINGTPKSSWVKLNTSASKGVSSLNVTQNNWKVGDKLLVVRSTRPKDNIVDLGSWKNNNLTQSEVRTIVGISGTNVTLNSGLQFDHLVYTNHWNDTFAPEIANMSRTITIKSANNSNSAVSGHVMFHDKAYVSYASFIDLGKENTLARYPLHFHMVRDAARGSYVIGNVMENSKNRFLTVHRTDYVLVMDNIGWKSFGHGYYLETADESYNLYYKNLAVMTFINSRLPNQALSFDANEGAGFWWASANNAFVKNISVEGDEFNFQFEVESMNVLKLNEVGQYADTDPDTVGFLRFYGNESRASLRYGMWFNGNPKVYNPAVIEANKIWNLWYAFGTDLAHSHITNLRIFDTAYGIRSTDGKEAKIENIFYHDIGNYGVGFRALSRGLVTIENTHFYDPPPSLFRFQLRDPGDPVEIHSRNYTMLAVDPDRGQILDAHPRSRTAGDWYIHNAPFANGGDVKNIPSGQSRNDGLSYSNKYSPHIGGDTKSADVNVNWPNNPIGLVDKYRPASSIYFPYDGYVTNNPNLRIMGYSVDQSEIVSVKVNGTSAVSKSSDLDYLLWECDITLNLGENIIVVQAIDEFGNVEQNMHEIRVILEGSSGIIQIPIMLKINR